MTDKAIENLRALLADFANRTASAPPPSKTGQRAGDRKRTACAECFQKVVRPVLDRFMLELKNAGHERWFYWYATAMIFASLLVYAAMPDTKKHSRIVED